jgi:transposase InsO family protein
MLNIAWLCKIAGVSRSGYYHWLAAETARVSREEQDRKDFELIRAAYRFRGFAKGGRGIYMRLLHMDPPVAMNIKKIRRLMRKYNLKCPIRKANPYRRMAKAMETSYVAPNLLNREFRQHGAKKVLLTDITYLLYGDGQKSYMSAILDAYTKQLLAHVVSSSLQVDFVLETVNNLIRDHGISLQAETLINSDQGSHYKSIKFIQLIKDSELRQSMSRKANCWDNAPQESFFGHMKDEIDIRHCQTHEEVKALIDDWADYYNNDRYQWDLARLSPNEYAQYIKTGVYPLQIPKTKGPDEG